MKQIFKKIYNSFVILVAIVVVIMGLALVGHYLLGWW